MSEIEEPVRRDEVSAWQASVDVIVAGLGAAGASAALEAHRAGVDVLIVERASGGGGASAASEGIFYLGGGTTLQNDLGYVDDPANMYAFMRASTSAPDEVALRSFCDGAAEHFDWLEAQGVPFERRAFTGKAVAVRTGEGLLMTGNEKLLAFADHATPVPRGHQTRGTIEEKGGAPAMRALIAAVEHEQIPVRYDSSVVGFVVDDTGAVRGVRIREAGAGEGFVEARRGVVLATGSFNLSEEMTQEHIPVVAVHGRPLGIPSNDGIGVRLGRSVGAATDGMDGVIATSSIYPPEQLIFGIIVNAHGRRFVAEDSYHGRTAYFIERQPDQRAYLLVDEAHFAYPDRGQPLVDVFVSLAEAESGLDLPAGSLRDTLEGYNAAVESGHDEFRKHPNWMAPIEPPIAAFDLSFGTAVYSYITLGGLSADADGRALRGNGSPVVGLYAVGAVASHLPRNGAEYASGMSLGPGSFFARRAGRHAATRVDARGGRRTRLPSR